MASASNPIASRLRRRIPPHRASNTAATNSASTTSHGRVTRHSIAQTFQNHKTGEEGGGDDVSVDDDEVLDEDDEGNDVELSPDRRSMKRPHTDVTCESGNPPKRRQLRSRTAGLSDGLQCEGRAYLSPSSDGASQRRRGAATSSRRSSREKKQSPMKKVPVEIHNDAGSKARKTKATKELLAPDATTIQSPPWITLPYMILCRIFTFVSEGLDDVDLVRQFVAASRTCRAFAEPVLTALYECPPLLSMNMAHSLVDLLDRSPSTTTFDYRRKVKVLRIEVGSLASRVYKGRHLDISRLVSHCPRLVDLQLHSYKDLPPYRQQSENLRWEYPRSLFEAMGALPRGSRGESTAPVIRLRSWCWNQRMMGKDLSLESISGLHLSPSFASLRRIRFVNYQRPSSHAKDAEDPQAMAEDMKQAETVAGLLSALPNLVHLAVESSTIANEHLLPLLPKGLQSLELVNCGDITAAYFSEYLLTHGQQLRYLTLHHNQGLSLAFLPILGDACPGLVSLQMNLTYYNQHAFYHDSNPLYDSLLLDSQVPIWPPSIEVIELEHLRKWEPSAAEVFFRSLVDRAPQMPMLRVLAIKAMLNIPWRMRCEMRDRWEVTLDRVFKRHITMPEPADSLQYYQNKAESLKAPSKAKPLQKDFESVPQRRSHRIAIHASSSSSRASSAARGLRRRGLFSYREPDSEEDIDFSQDDEQDDEGEHTDGQDDNARGGGTGAGNTYRSPDHLFIHGMCDVVDIRIDNQKPTEHQYNMGDFLDGTDPSSDNEWTGDEDEDFEYAW
ncbi:hypothetical protein CMQ_4298 [Grosmannia clavigera kw1407]|uniref:F-box domain containing protein n=1 Tax=Grosmannia clavigera (strain kw1407 / UAMH 11150) TaxID=655863 RepID=F0XTF4_GROCL|nr:uncharacterized protein CMQ_4298 [Grosmannia clavigera kw1407]EFW98446.1 hypothetical protein CMQ_4298 [Grosmannia clavigera kw1407]